MTFLELTLIALYLIGVKAFYSGLPYGSFYKMRKIIASLVWPVTALTTVIKLIATKSKID